MWPFRKKPVKKDTGESFQDFLRTYVPPEPMPIVNPIDVETICPLCLDRFPPGTISRDYPSCSDCSSEGMDFGVELLTEYLAGKTSEDFETMLANWETADGFLPEYKALKTKRILKLKDLKFAKR
ncbi:MAG: hypothetical protein ACKE5M_01260 [Methylophilaceae bacterium]